MKINFKAIPEAMKVFGKILEKNKSTILVGAGLLGWVGTAVLVGRAAPKAQTAIDKAKRDMYQNYEGEDMDEVALTPIETVKTTWQYYIPAAGLGLVSSAAIIYAHKLDLSKVASLVSTYQLTKGEYEKLKDKIVEKDGPEKLKEYEKDIHKDTLMTVRNDGIYNTGKGLDIFYDPTSGMKFYNDLWKVEIALKHMYKACVDDGCYPLSDLRYELGLPRNGSEDRFEFTLDTVRNVDEDTIASYFFDYHGNDLEEGDTRVCIWLDLMPYLVDRKYPFQ